MRARNIKPGFYINEDLAECSIWARFIFPGLWCLADRDGRLEDRPKRIKGELLRFDTQDIEALLQELASKKDAQGVPFIIRYQNSSGRFIQISKFKRHQSPHYSEKASAIKPPDTPEYSENDGVLKGGSQPPDSLNPDSLNPDSLNPESLQKPLSAAKPPLPDCPHAELRALYSELLPMLAQPRVWDGARAEITRARWLQCSRKTDEWPGYETHAEGIAFWRLFFEGVAACRKLTDGMQRHDGSIWKPDLPWLMKAENFAKVIEGKYA